MIIVFLVFEVIIVLTAILVGVFSRKIFDKKTMAYSIPIFLLTFGLYSYGYAYQIGYYDFSSFSSCIVAAIKAFVFEIKNDYVSDILTNDILFEIEFYIAICLSGITLIFSILGFVKISVTNFLRCLFAVRHRNPDIVIGFSNNAIEYCKKNKNAILWVNAFEKEKNFDRKYLFEDHICFINLKISPQKLSVILRFLNKHSHIIVFEPSQANIGKYFCLIENIKVQKNKYIHFYFETFPEYSQFLNKQLTLKANKNSNVIASSFDIYELIGREFSIRYNFAQFLPLEAKETANDLLIKQKYDIDVIVIGTGKTNVSLLKSCILNNNFVSLDEDKKTLYSHIVNYHLFDICQSSFCKPTLSSLNNLIDKDDSISSKTVYGTQIPISISTKSFDVNDSRFFEELKRITKDKKDGITFFFIAYSSGFNNSALADKILSNIKGEKIVFYNVDEDGEILLSNDSRLIPIGFKKEILKHDIIVNEDLYELAINNNEQYFMTKGASPKNYSELDIIEKFSNIYSDANIRFKLNLLGLDYSKINVKSITKKEYYQIYWPEHESNKKIVYENYSDYFQINKRVILAFIEHTRWTTYYLINDFTTMALKDVKIIDGKIKHKDMNKREHACITDYYKLDQLHNSELELCQKNGVNLTLSEIDTYKYDFQRMDNLFDELTSLGYFIHKRYFSE